MKAWAVASLIHLAQESSGGFDFTSVEKSIEDKSIGL